MTAAPLRHAAVEGYRQLLMPLGFVAAVALLSAATAVLVALPLYVAATRATPVYNVALGSLAVGALALAVGRALLRRARRSGDAGGYARRLATVALWSLLRLVAGIAVALLSLLAFRIGPAAGVAAAAAALAVIALLVGVGRGGPPPGRGNTAAAGR